MGDEKTRKLFVSFVELLDGDGLEDEGDDLPPHTFRHRKSMLYSNVTNQPQQADSDGDMRNEHYEKSSIGLYAVSPALLLLVSRPVGLLGLLMKYRKELY